jgi:hypothetical protein
MGARQDGVAQEQKKINPSSQGPRVAGGAVPRPPWLWAEPGRSPRPPAGAGTGRRPAWRRVCLCVCASGPRLWWRSGGGGRDLGQGFHAQQTKPPAFPSTAPLRVAHTRPLSPLRLEGAKTRPSQATERVMRALPAFYSLSVRASLTRPLFFQERARGSPPPHTHTRPADAYTGRAHTQSPSGATTDKAKGWQKAKGRGPARQKGV